MSIVATNAISYNHFATNALVVVGAGPVGLVSSLLLSHFHIPHVLVEQRTGPDNHPQAHFINHRSMEILRELGRLDRAVLASSACIEEWRRFVYCTNLADLPRASDATAVFKGSMLGMVDHFASGAADGSSPCPVTHFPQNEFVRLLRRRAMGSPFCCFMEGCRADVRETPKRITVKLTSLHSAQGQVLQAPLVIGADGARSAIRKGLGIDLVAQSGDLQRLINVHFFSLPLAERLRSSMPAMLYFIYSPAGVGVIVAHNLSRGEFVAQIPFFPPLQPFASFSKSRCAQLIQKWIGREIPVQVKSIRQWRMRVSLASRFRSPGGRCFLVGDAAHQFTPAGGFGMNTGIQDAHNLIWKIALALKLKQAGNNVGAEQLLSTYESERRPVALNNARWSIENYEQTLAVPRAMGLNPGAAGVLHYLLDRIPGPLPVKRALFTAAMTLGLKQIILLRSNSAIARHRKRSLMAIFRDAKNQTLQLLFPGQDLGFCYAPQSTDRLIENAFTADPFKYMPSLRLGGRMPHFWIQEKAGKRLSVLDLPWLMMGIDRIPRHIMIIMGAADQTLQKKVEMQTTMAHPATLVFIGTPSEPSGSISFHFNGDKPPFFPRTAAIMMRPDGHIQWFETLR